jgi:hypothetical protein
MHQSNSFRNLFIIKKFDITERLIKSSGYCENAGYGFINDVDVVGKAWLKIYPLNKIELLND